MTPLPRALAELCTDVGVATEFWDWRGRRIEVSADTLTAVLAALGFDASTDAAAAAALADRREAACRREVPHCLVVREGVTHWLGAVPGEIVVELEDGSTRELTAVGRPVGTPGGAKVVAVPPDLPLGWHRLLARGSGDGGPGSAAHLIVTPPRLAASAQLGRRRAWGFTTQLYAVRSRRSWGIGDLGDLAELAGWSGRALGAGFVLVNPLHAAEPVAPMEPSPYLPSTRRFVNPIYLRVEAVPEYAYLSPAQRAYVDAVSADMRKRSTTDDPLDRDAAWSAKRAALELVHRVARGPGREAAFRDFLRREGAALTDFATWCALAEVRGPLWHQWPASLRDPRSDAVEAARVELADRIGFHTWLQWIADEQLAAAQGAAREAGMSLGILHDLAVGVHAEGADAWALQSVLAPGVTVGAPPDEFNPHGQTWSQPPWHPQRLAIEGYQPYGDLLRAVLRHAAGLRVDHVMGLFRLWWVPDGMPPTAGTYVRYDHEALVGVLALEAHRAGALVIGEDLGTVEPSMREELRDRGILGTSVLWFERDWAGDTTPLPPDRWRPLCLATVTTHDLPPTAAYLSGDHLAILQRLGLLEQPYEQALAAHTAAVDEWVKLLRRLALLRPGASNREILIALHRLLTWTPALLVGVSLSDATNDRRSANVPGTIDEYPNWRLALADGTGRPVLLDDLVANSAVMDLARAVGVAMNG